MRSMINRYGSKKGKKIFYATARKWQTQGSKKQKSAQPKFKRAKKRK